MQSEIEGNTQLHCVTALPELWTAELSSPQSAETKCGFSLHFKEIKKLHSKKKNLIKYCVKA